MMYHREADTDICPYRSCRDSMFFLHRNVVQEASSLAGLEARDLELTDLNLCVPFIGQKYVENMLDIVWKR